MPDRFRWFRERRGVAGPIASALLLALAFAGLWPLVFVALIPWLLSLRETTSRQAWNRGYGFGLLFSLTQLWWLGDLAYKWTGSAILGIVPWLLASLLSAVYYGLLGRLVRSCYGLNALWAIPLVWAGMEVFRSYIPVLAFPWALIAEPLIVVPDLAQSAYYGTIYLASALVMFANVAFLRDRWWSLTKVLTAFVLAAVHFERPYSEAPTLAAGQPGVDMAFDPDANVKIGPAVDDLLTRFGPADYDEAGYSISRLLVLPEGIARGGASLPPGTPFHVPNGGSIVFGGQRGEGPVYQSAFAHDRKGWTYADKTRLVIFGEFIPGRDYFPFLQNAFHLPGGDLSAGDKVSTVRAGNLTVGPLICFEALFPDLGIRQARAGSDVLAVMSIDDWFALPARERLARAAQWRAIETGRSVVRAGSLGKSMIVSPFGRIVSEAPYGKRTLVKGETPGGRDVFPLVWLFPLVAFGSLFTVPLLARRTKKAAEASQ